MTIHSTCEIDLSAQIAPDAVIGPGCVIGPNAVIERGVVLGPHVVIGPNTTLRENVKASAGVVIGTEPQDLKYEGSQTACEIGPRTVLREYCTIHRGTKARGATVIGSDCFLMAQTHVAHDCLLGNNVTMASYTGLGGHCEVGDRAVLGGFVAIHQFVKVGKLAMVAGFTGLRKDAPPFMITYGHPPARVYGLNSIGLRRSGMDTETRGLLKSAFRILFRSGLNFADAVREVRSGLPDAPEIRYLLEFIETSKRGVCSGASGNYDEIVEAEFKDSIAQTIKMSTAMPRDISE